jgi:hypothetical protein
MADAESVIDRTRVSVDIVTKDSVLAHVPQDIFAQMHGDVLAQLPSDFLAHVPGDVFAHLPPNFLDTLRAAPAEWIRVNGFKMETQCHINWCWAAVAQSIINYYEPNKGWTQTDIAKLMMPGYTYEAECYKGGLAEDDLDLPYNKGQILEIALSKVECYHHSQNPPDKEAPLQAVQQWINGEMRGMRRPVCVRIRWPNLNGHFVVIDAYCRGTNLLHVSDPWGPQFKEISHDDMSHHYTTFDSPVEGSWTDTMYTKHPKTPEP